MPVEPVTIISLALEVHSLRQRRQNSILGLFASTDHGCLDANDPQTNHFWPPFRSGFQKNWVYKGKQSFFVTHSLSSFTVERSSLDTYFSPSFLTHSLFLSTATATIKPPSKGVPSSCRPLKIYLPSTQASDRTIAEPCYQTFHTHIIPFRTYFVQIHRHPSSSLSVRLFFLMFCRSMLTSFALRIQRVPRWQPPLLPPMYRLYF